MNPIEQYFFSQDEPYQSIMLYIRSVIRKTLPEIEERISYKIPFYHYHKNPLCYLNILKGSHYVDIAFVQGILLEIEYKELTNDSNRKQVRSLQVKSIEDIDEQMFIKLLKEAALLLDGSKSAWNL